MTRNLWRLGLDGLLALAGLTLLTTGLLMEWVLPPGSRGASVWSWTRHDWGEVHFIAAMVVLALVFVHVLLNWTWVCSVAARWLWPRDSQVSKTKRRVSGVLTVLLLIGAVGGFLWAAQSALQRDPSGSGGGEHGRHSQQTLESAQPAQAAFLPGSGRRQRGR